MSLESHLDCALNGSVQPLMQNRIPGEANYARNPNSDVNSAGWRIYSDPPRMGEVYRGSVLGVLVRNMYRILPYQYTAV